MKFCWSRRVERAVVGVVLRFHRPKSKTIHSKQFANVDGGYCEVTLLIPRIINALNGVRGNGKAAGGIGGE